MHMKTRLMHGAAALFMLALVSTTSLAQDTASWPVKPIRLIIPYAAGGPADVVGREIAHALALDVRQSVSVENLGGGMGVPALGVVARADPDGQTLLLAAIGNMVLKPMLSRQGGADLVARLRPVSTVSIAPHVLVVSAKWPIQSVQELVDYARARPGRVSFGSAGTGGTAHLGVEMFRSLTGTDVLHVPYKGTSGATIDLISGEITALFSTPPSLQPLAEKGHVRMLAATGPSQSASLRNLPLMSDTIPGYEYTSWYAMYAPLATPAGLVDRIQQALDRVLRQSALVAKIEAAGTELHAGTAQEVLAWTQRDTDKWRKVIQAAHIQLE